MPAAEIGVAVVPLALPILNKNQSSLRCLATCDTESFNCKHRFAHRWRTICSASWVFVTPPDRCRVWEEEEDEEKEEGADDNDDGSAIGGADDDDDSGGGEDEENSEFELVL